MLTGSCTCRAVRLELREPTMFASHCHCRTCRTTHGAAFVTWTAVPPDALTVHGEVRWYTSSPGVRRGFCGTCGSPLLYVGESAPDRVYVPVGVLDRLDRPVEDHVSYEEHVPWLEGVEHLPCLIEKTQQQTPWVTTPRRS